MSHKHRPSPETRLVVQRGASFGFTEEMLCKLLNLSEKTLRKNYRSELSTGHLRATHAVASKLYELCMQGDRQSIMFWLSRRAGWVDAQPTVTVNASAQSGCVVKVPMAMSESEWNEL